MNITAVQEIAFDGELGPEHAPALRHELSKMLDQPRPQIAIDLTEVETLHLGIVNVLIDAHQTARRRMGDVRVFVTDESNAKQALARVGLIATLRP